MSLHPKAASYYLAYINKLDNGRWSSREERDRYVVRQRKLGKTLQEIATDIGRTKERVRQMIAKAVRRGIT